jgi:hypothetical protein
MKQKAKRHVLAARVTQIVCLACSQNLRKHVSPKRQFNFSGLHVISKKTELLGV